MSRQIRSDLKGLFSREFRDPEQIRLLKEMRDKERMPWAEIERKFGLRPNRGMNAIRIYRRGGGNGGRSPGRPVSIGPSKNIAVRIPLASYEALRKASILHRCPVSDVVRASIIACGKREWKGIWHLDTMTKELAELVNPTSPPPDPESLRKAVRAGEIAFLMRSKIAPGSWGKWIRKNLKIGQHTLNNYRHVFEAHKGGRLEKAGVRSLAEAYQFLGISP